MSSSNRHWPSMFKSKPCNGGTIHGLNRQNDLTTRTPFSSLDKTPEPKPRWNPKPEQIRILESIFNSGMVNPPREEIRRIRTQLQQYGPVGDANVFYWFQNRKSRSKHKDKHVKKLQRTSKDSTDSKTITAPSLPDVVSSCSSDNREVCFPDELSGVVMKMNSSEKLVSSVTPNGVLPPVEREWNPPARSTVFINDVAFQICVGRPINVKDVFGSDAFLFHSSGELVPTNECGFTLQPLQNGGFYYLLPKVAPLDDRYCQMTADHMLVSQLPYNFNMGVE